MFLVARRSRHHQLQRCGDEPLGGPQQEAESGGILHRHRPERAGCFQRLLFELRLVEVAREPQHRVDDQRVARRRRIVHDLLRPCDELLVILGDIEKRPELIVRESRQDGLDERPGILEIAWIGNDLEGLNQTPGDTAVVFQNTVESYPPVLERPLHTAILDEGVDEEVGIPAH